MVHDSTWMLHIDILYYSNGNTHLLYHFVHTCQICVFLVYSDTSCHTPKYHFLYVHDTKCKVCKHPNIILMETWHVFHVLSYDTLFSHVHMCTYPKSPYLTCEIPYMYMCKMAVFLMENRRVVHNHSKMVKIVHTMYAQMCTFVYTCTHLFTPFMHIAC